MNQLAILKVNQNYQLGSIEFLFQKPWIIYAEKKTKKRFAFVESLFGKNDELSHDPPDFFHPGIIAEKKDDAAALFKALSTLPPNQNTAFVLNKIQGLN